jgi:hypothetical protein
MSEVKNYLKGLFDNATVLGIDGELVTSNITPPPEPTRDNFRGAKQWLDAVDAGVAAVHRYEQIPPAKRKALMDKGLNMSEMLLIMTLQIMADDTSHLSVGEVNAIFELRELHND